MKLNHSVLSGSEGGSLWRLLCLLVHPKTQHLKSLFGTNIVYLQQLQQVISNGGGGPQLLTQGQCWARYFKKVIIVTSYFSQIVIELLTALHHYKSN